MFWLSICKDGKLEACNAVVSEIMAEGSRKTGLIARQTMQEVPAGLKITH
jgi:hypothetical protein